VSHDDVLLGYRLQRFDLAGRTSVSRACRTFGVHRSTYYARKAQVDRQGLEVLRPRERRRPKMPNQLSVLVEERIVAFSLGHRGQLGRPDACGQTRHGVNDVLAFRLIAGRRVVCLASAPGVRSARTGRRTSSHPDRRRDAFLTPQLPACMVVVCGNYD